MGLIELIADGGQAGERSAHHECRDCGQNVAQGVDTCPECGGDVAVYTL